MKQDNVYRFSVIKYWCIFNLSQRETNCAALILECERMKKEKKNNTKTMVSKVIIGMVLKRKKEEEKGSEDLTQVPVP
jgi:hypothetical protein